MPPLVRGENTVILGPLREGAVSEADWGSALSKTPKTSQFRHSLRPVYTQGTSLKEGGEGRWTDLANDSINRKLVKSLANNDKCFYNKHITL